MKLLVCMLLVTIVVMAKLIDDSEGWRRRRRRRSSGQQADTDATQCPTLTPPENGALSPEGANSYDDVVTFTCNQGYELEGASRVSCQADRTWNGSVPTCTQNHAFEVLRTANQTYNGVDFFAIEAKLPEDGLSAGSEWCRDYQNLCASYGLRPTGCGENRAVESGGNSHPNATACWVVWRSGSVLDSEPEAPGFDCVTEYNSDPYINNVLGCAPAWGVAQAANLAFSAGATGSRSFGFHSCRTTGQCQRGIYENRDSLSYTSAAFGSDGSGDRIVYTVCAGSAVGNNKCAIGNGGCAQVCIHTQNSHKCICRHGFTLMADGQGCEATQCPTLPPPENGALSPEGANSYDDVVTFTCNQGYELEGASSVRCQADQIWSDPVPTCTPIQCPTLTPPENGALSPEGANSYDDVVTFTCNQGYELEGASQLRCRANQTWSDPVPTCTQDQCATDNGGCAHNCTNVPGSYTCSCRRGFVLMTNNHGCEEFVTFTAWQGRRWARAEKTLLALLSFGLSFSPALILHVSRPLHHSASPQCSQLSWSMAQRRSVSFNTDECASSNGGCEQTCTNTPGGFLCSCQHGYTLNRDGLTCDDVNECEVSPGICGRKAECVNLNGTFDCKCSPGFSMGAGCEDVDECSGEHSCDENAFCVNQPGSYYCVCLDGFTGNGTTCTEVVKTTTPTSPTTTVKSTTVTTLAGYTTPLTSTTVSTESSAAPSTTSTSLKATTTKGDAIDSDLEETTTSPLSTPIVTFVSHEPPEASKTSLLQTRTINTIADLQYDKDDPGSILDQLIPYKAQFDKASSSKDRKVDSTTCTDAMTALARLSRASAAEDSTETMATITRDIIALCGTLPLDAQAEGGYVVGAMADSIKRGALGGASMEELAPKAAAVVDTVSSLMESAGSETVSEDEEDVAALGKLPPRKREEFRQKMKEKLREKQERQWAYQREVTRELQRNLDSIADALLDSKGGGERVELGSKAVQMVLEMTSGGRLGGAAVSAHAGGVTFPGPHALNEGGVAKDAAMKARVVGYDRNPYVWDESARDIKSSVVDIELRRPGGGTLKVKDLSEDITVVLKNAPDMFPAPRLVKYSPFPNDTMVFRTFSARRNQTYGVLVSLVAPYPGAVMYGKLGDFPNETDYDFKKEFSWDDFIAKTVPPHGDVHVTYTVLQPDTAVDNGTEEYTIGLRVDGCPPEGCPYSVDITRLDCVFWDPGIDAELGSWKRDGCRVSPASTLAHTVCLCDHLTGINFKTVFSKFKDLVNNYAVWTTMVVVMGMFFVMIYPARRKDKADEQKPPCLIN
ncbi:carbohydrate binding [Branchiostoma belcheri]|nr:carbohydrate binding [Branchiostoma belcheri]